jgi:DNA topoisomerase-1
MAKTLVIVESPTKAKTIEKFLGKDFEVKASFGHVRDLPNNASEVPESLKKEKWAKLGVNPDKDFETLYIVPELKKKRVKELKDSLKNADELLLATDEDREGESISWHLLEVLKPKIPTKRLVFHEITKSAIQHALESARDVDQNLVKAQETRRIIDRLFGYSVSPLLWKKMKPQLSAGRVQSVAVRLLVERERERIAFRKAVYWDLKAIFSKVGSSKEEDRFEAELVQLGSQKVAIGKDFDPKTGKLLPDSTVVQLDAQMAASLRERLLTEKPTVLSVEEKPFVQRPYSPFTTSLLQQEGSRKLGYGAKRTMAVAQTLYENGFITYMRTDSVTLSNEAIEGARSLVAKEFGPQYLPAEPRVYKTKVKNAQEAHEAIRPAGTTFTDPAVVRAKLGEEAFKLYDLIWKRTLASQMKDATGQRVVVHVKSSDAQFRASGKTIEFAGFLRAYVEGSDDPEGDLSEQERVLPKLAPGEALDTAALDAVEHQTQPPARYTEGSLIKELERLGIGRPSTWATIVDVVLSRDYAFKKGTALVPTFLASAVAGLMERYFTNLVDYNFTAQMEDDLDSISRGEVDNLGYLKKFYFGNGHPGLKSLVSMGEEKIDPRDVCGLPIGQDANGKAVEVRIGRYGPFISNGEQRAGVPENFAPDELSVERALQLLAEASKGAEALGQHPETGQPIFVKKGRFGPYVQLGEQTEGGDKPKMVSLLPGMSMESVDMATALRLLALPRNLGKHPTLNDDIIATLGRFGPYVKCGPETRSITTGVSVLDLTTEQAIELLAQPRRRGRGAVAAAAPLKDLGKHPQTQAAVVVKSGRYGPYVTDGTVNASLPRGADPAALTMEEAVSLLQARADKIAADGGVVKKKRGAKKTAAPKAPKAAGSAKRGKKKKGDDAAEGSAAEG